MNLRRMKQVWKYGIKHAEQIASENPNVKQKAIFHDILRCYCKYGMWSNQYLKEKFWELPSEKRKEIGEKYLLKNKEREEWLKDYFNNKKFLNKWSSFKYESTAELQNKRLEAYCSRFNIGNNCHLGHDVIIDRHHYLNGTLKIGNHVTLSKHVYIDYSGDVIIEDGVKITQGVIIESHHRDLEAYNQGINVNVPTKLLIRENAYIGSRAIILDSCNYIGKNVRIGAGAVVTKDIPDNAVAVGVPAKVVKYL